QAKHSACIGTQTRISRRKLEFTHTREGFRMFETILNRERAKNTCCRVLIAMEPSGIYWLALYERLTGCGYEVCLVNCQAVCHNRSRSSADLGGEGKPGCAFGPHRGGENPSVSGGPSPLPEPRTKNRRSRATGKTSIEPTRIGREHCRVRSHR